MDIQDILDRDNSPMGRPSAISNPREYIGKIHKIIKNFDIEDEDDIPSLAKKINKFIIKNPDINSIDTKDLNAEIDIKGYVFCKDHGQQRLIKKQYIPMCRSKTKPIEDKITTIEVMLNQLKQETSDYIKQMEIRINTIEQCLKVIENDNNKQDILLNKVVNFINDNFIEPEQPQTQTKNKTPSVNYSSDPLEFLKRKF